MNIIFSSHVLVRIFLFRYRLRHSDPSQRNEYHKRVIGDSKSSLATYRHVLYGSGVIYSVRIQVVDLGHDLKISLSLQKRNTRAYSYHFFNGSEKEHTFFSIEHHLHGYRTPCRIPKLVSLSQTSTRSCSDFSRIRRHRRTVHQPAVLLVYTHANAAWFTPYRPVFPVGCATEPRPPCILHHEQDQIYTSKINLSCVSHHEPT